MSGKNSRWSCRVKARGVKQNQGALQGQRRADENEKQNQNSSKKKLAAAIHLGSDHQQSS